MRDINPSTRWWESQITALRFHVQNERMRRMSRLSEKLALAAAVAPRQHAKIEARADAIIARESGIEHQADEAFTRHEMALREAETGLDDLDAALRVMSNNPPLEHSTPLPSGSGVVRLGPHPDQPEVAETASQTFPQGS